MKQSWTIYLLKLCLCAACITLGTEFARSRSRQGQSNLLRAATQASTSGKERSCRWLHRQYVPSALEQRWQSAAKSIASGHKEWPPGCSMYRADTAAIDSMMHAVAALNNANSSATTAEIAAAGNLSFHERVSPLPQDHGDS